jgi:transposase-like protein
MGECESQQWAGTQYLQRDGSLMRSSSLVWRWYLRFRLSYRDLVAIASELGIAVAPSTILRWVIRYAGAFISRWAPFEMPVGRSWRADETYIRVNGGWMYLYRAVDKRGRTVASHLSRTRDEAAARIFFRQALKRHGEPRTITLDGFEPSHSALRRMGMRNEFNNRWDNPVKIRSCKYLNNIVEQDHRRVKFRIAAILGFQILRKCQDRDRWNRADPETKEGPVWCSVPLW